MLTRHRYTAVALLAVFGYLDASTAVAQSPPPSQSQTNQAQPQAGASTDASGQGAVGVSRSGASAQGSGNADAAGHVGDTRSQLATDSSVNAVLTKPVDSRNSKPGDPVNARTTQPARTKDGTVIPKGTELVGHVSEARAGGEGQAGSAMGIVFDKAVTRDGREIPLRNVGIRALAAAEGAAAASAGDSGMMRGSGAMSGGALAAGRGGGGLVGRTTGAAGGAVGGGLGAAGNATGSIGAAARGPLQAAPGAVGGLDGSGFLTTSSSGVFGLRDVSLATETSGGGQGSLVTSTGKSVRLDEGTRMLLGAQAEASGHGDRASDAGKAPSGKESGPDRR